MKKCIFFFFCITIALTSFAKANQGEIIYEQACKTCHAMPTAQLMKAPPAHNRKQWETKIQAAKAIAQNNPKKYKTAMDYLVASVKNGKGAMVPGGMCIDKTTPDHKCTNADYSAAIHFMAQEKNE